MKEQLTCTQCNKNWRREKTRGRKPTLCPKCTKTQQTTQKIKEIRYKKREIETQPITQQTNTNASQHQDNISPGIVYQYYHPSIPEKKELKESTKKGSTWQCNLCKHQFKIYVPLTAFPTHKCSPNGKSHSCTRVDTTT